MRKSTAKRFRTLHRTAGVFVAAFLVIIAVTGVAVNHADALGLSSHPVPAFVASWYYEGDLAQVEGYRVDAGFVYGVDERVYLNETDVSACHELHGATTVATAIVALCGNDLLLISSDGRLIERLGTVHGVPKTVRRVGHAGERLILDTEDGIVGFDPDTLTTAPATGTVDWQQSTQVPAALTRPLLADTVSWEQFLLDVHSGRLLGLSGTLFSDIVAVLLVAMAVTGLVLWRRASSTRARRH